MGTSDTSKLSANSSRGSASLLPNLPTPKPSFNDEEKMAQRLDKSLRKIGELYNEI